MQVNFTSQQNYNNNCSFGKWKKIIIGNHDDPLKLAYALKNVMNACPKTQVCFQVPGETPFNVTPSILALIDYCTKHELNVFANHAMPRKHFTALKKCLTAGSAMEAENIANKVKFINVKA